MREFDVHYHSRVCIDNDIRTSNWYSVTFKNNYVHEMTYLPDKKIKPDLRVLGISMKIIIRLSFYSFRY